MSFRYEEADTTKVFRRRTAESFLVAVRRISKKYSYEKIADMLGVNKWHVWQIANNPYYFPSNALCRRLHLVKSIRAPRIAISKRDPVSAARSIRENCYYSASELIEELRK